MSHSIQAHQSGENIDHKHPFPLNLDHNQPLPLSQWIWINNLVRTSTTRNNLSLPPASTTRKPYLYLTLFGRTNLVSNSVTTSTASNPYFWLALFDSTYLVNPG